MINTCISCNKARKLIIDNICNICLNKAGYKYCKYCKSKKLLHSEFYLNRSECKDCSPNKQISTHKCEICGLHHDFKRKCSELRNKTCKRCHIKKPSSQFHTLRICKECLNG
jgi:hypothetical protein